MVGSFYVQHRRKAFRGGGIWTPAQITTALWLKEEGTAASWTDHSGNNRHAAQATPANQPSLANTLNGLTVRTFDGVNDHLITNWNLSNQHSIFAVAERGAQTPTSVSSLRHFLAASVNDTSTGFAGYGTRSGATQTIDFAVGSGRIVNVTNAWLTNETIILSATYNGTTLTGWKNGSSYGSVNLSASSFGLVAIGGDPVSGFVDRYFAGKVGEIIALPTVSSLDIRQRTEGYLAHRWGLTTNLAADHPYKNSPPYI